MGYLIQEGKITQDLRNYLIAHGYPPETICLEYPIGQYRVDLAIIDPLTSLPIQLFEVKSNFSRHSLEMGREQLRKITQDFPNHDFTTFLVYPSEQKPFFKVKQIFFEKRENEVNINLNGEIGTELNFSTQKNSSRLKHKKNILTEKEKNIKNLKIIFFILAIILTVMLVAEITVGMLLKLPIEIITPTRLYTIILIIVMLIFPYISSIRWADLEIKFLSDNEEKE